MKKIALAVFLSLGLCCISPYISYAEEAVAVEEVTDSTTDAEVSTEEEETFNGYPASQFSEASRSLVDTLIHSEEQITSYLATAEDPALESLVTSWDGLKDELGEYEEMGDSNVTENKGMITVTSTVKFSNRDAELVINYNEEDMSYASISFDKILTLSEKMSKAGMNTVMGIGTVFVMLIIMSLLISCFQFIPKIQAAFTKKKEEPAVTAAPVAAPAPVAEAEDVTDDLELVAVISAAIAAYEGTSADGFVVRSINKKRR